MNHEQLAELKQLEAEATPAPWKARKSNSGSVNFDYRVDLPNKDTINLLQKEDAKLIAALRNHARELIAAVKGQ